VSVQIGIRTDTGRIRDGNEDSYLVQEPLFVVADGMGGHSAGEVASATAIEVIKDRSAEASASQPETLAAIVRDANQAIRERAEQDSSLRGMGTTCTLALIEGSHVQIAHVGDSRAYLFREGQLSQLTEDHTLVSRMVSEGRLRAEDAEHHPQRSIITRALGTEPDVEVDLLSFEVVPGDRLMLCSDGLSSMINFDTIKEILGRVSESQAAADQLVEAANEAGGEDNITVVLLTMLPEGVTADQGTVLGSVQPSPAERVDTDTDSSDTRVSRSWLRLAFGTLVLLLLLACAAFAYGRYYIANHYYVGADETGVVTIYRGVPGQFAGFQLNSVEESSSVTVDALPEFMQGDLEEGKPADSLEEARAIVTNLQERANEFSGGSSNKGQP
jgi:protein phosphatase